MFNRRTLFVVGAGASAEVNFPVGAQLAKSISKKLDVKYDDFGSRIISGDAELFLQVTHSHQRELAEYQNAAWRIRDGIHLSNSIDDFLDIHRSDSRVQLLGKSAIVKSILEAERNSLLFYDRSKDEQGVNFQRIEDTWLIRLMRMLGRGIPHEHIATIFDNVSFLIFNYDRCIEQFLFHAIQKLYAIKEDAASEILDKLSIVHPYGTVGQLKTRRIHPA